MNVLDENIPLDQRDLLRTWGVHCRVIGQDIAPISIRDDNILALLHRLKQPTLFTRDEDFFKHRLCHPACEKTNISKGETSHRSLGPDRCATRTSFSWSHAIWFLTSGPPTARYRATVTMSFSAAMERHHPAPGGREPLFAFASQAGTDSNVRNPSAGRLTPYPLHGCL